MFSRAGNKESKDYTSIILQQLPSRLLSSTNRSYMLTTPSGALTSGRFIQVYACASSHSLNRPLNLTTVDQIFQIRKVNLHRVFETFPQRKFVLLADTSNGDIMKQYPAMVTQFPGQVQCILLRNTSATDSGNNFPVRMPKSRDIRNPNLFDSMIPPVSRISITLRICSSGLR
jgi:hypothetical protein